MSADNPICNECGQWTPSQFRTVDETRNGSRYVLCEECDDHYPGIHGPPLMRQ